MFTKGIFKADVDGSPCLRSDVIKARNAHCDVSNVIYYKLSQGVAPYSFSKGNVNAMLKCKLKVEL